MINDLVNLQEFLANNDSIQSYCTDNFSKNCMVVLGFDDDKPPTEGNCPFIEILGNTINAKGKQDSGGKFLMSIVISNKDKTSEGNKITHDGFVQVNQLTDIVITKILNEQGFEGLIQQIESKNERGMPTPLHGVRLLVTVKEIYSYCEE